MALNRVLFFYKNMTHNVMKRTPAELFFTRKVALVRQVNTRSKKTEKGDKR